MAEGFQREKRAVLKFYQALDQAEGDAIPDVMAAHCADDLLWRGFHPFDEMRGARTVGERFWQPLRKSLTALQRRMDVFMAGRNALAPGDEVWVCSMGHLMGLFDRPWLNIRPTGRITLLRYCAFHKMTAGKITQTAMYFDIPHLMMQAGLQPFPPQTGAHLVQPGPMTHDGVMLGDRPEAESRETLALIEQMISDLGRWDSGLPLCDELAQTWADDMIWWGPAGIGSTYTIARYAEQHSAVFRASFAERTKTRHLCRMAEGHFGGFFGWPNFSAVPTGGFMGMPATGRAGAFRVIDIYRRVGDRLAENWVFIDLLHFWKQQGVDILARSTGIDPPQDSD